MGYRLVLGSAFSQPGDYENICPNPSEASNSTLIRYLRALVREGVSDLTGALSDIEIEDLGPEHALTKARILAKLGFGEEAISTLRTLLRDLNERSRRYWASSAMDIAGRRFERR